MYSEEDARTKELAIEASVFHFHDIDQEFLAKMR